MKKTLILACVAGFIGSAKAQSVLTPSLLPAPGVVQYMNYDTLKKASNVPSNTGVSQTWNFTTLVSNRKDTTSYTTPSGQGNQADFSTATVMGTNAGLTTAYKINTGEYSVLGNYGGGASNRNRTLDGKSDYPLRKLKLPVTYLTSYKDTQKYITKQDNPAVLTALRAFLGINADSIRMKHRELKSVKCDAYGKVILPGGFSFDKTLRVKDSTVSYDSTELYSDGSWQQPSGTAALYLGPKKVVTKTITWYADSNNFPFPAVIINYVNGTSLGNIAYLKPVVAPITIIFDVQNARCNGESNGSINAGVSGGKPNYTYKWSTGATTSSISNVKAGGYSITVTDANGTSLVKTGTVAEPDPISISASAKDPSKPNNDGEIYLEVSGGNQGSFFGTEYFLKWSTGIIHDNIGTPPVPDTLKGLSSGTYLVTVTDSRGCSATASVVLKAFTSGISGISRKEISELYPNPCSNVLNVSFELQAAQAVSIKIIDMMGREVLRLKDKEEMNAGKHQFNLNVESLPQGIFLYQLETGGISEIRKINHVTGR